MAEFTHPRPKFISFIECKCPRCGRDKVFKHNFFHVTKFAETKTNCAKCQLTYHPEPGFFFGAMYWSYAMLVGLIVILSILFYTFGAFDYAMYFIPLIIILLLPLIFRYSRMLMLYIVYPLMYKAIFYQSKA